MDNQEADIMMEKIRILERRLDLIEKNQALTIPIYDSTNFPQDAVEGQVAIAPIV